MVRRILSWLSGGALREVRWRDVVALCWRQNMQWLDVKTQDDTFPFSTMLAGRSDFAKCVLRHLPPSGVSTLSGRNRKAKKMGVVIRVSCVSIAFALLACERPTVHLRADANHLPQPIFVIEEVRGRRLHFDRYDVRDAEGRAMLTTRRKNGYNFQYRELFDAVSREVTYGRFEYDYVLDTAMRWLEPGGHYVFSTRSQFVDQLSTENDALFWFSVDSRGVLVPDPQ
jgi:hypothetical protein